MIKQVPTKEKFFQALDQLGLDAALRESGSALIKINLASPPKPGHPRTDPTILTNVVEYINDHGANCAIIEGADGFLEQNINRAGLEKLIKGQGIKLIDIDLEESEPVEVNSEIHYLSKCLKDYTVRIGIPVTTKRSGMVFSNNVKLFLGAVPRRLYQTGESKVPRPGLHINLHKSIANVYQAMMAYAPFNYYVNGGMALIEGPGEFNLKSAYVGKNAVELDHFLLQHLNIETPEYLKLLDGVK
jgi:uncharacterized protein (DUF362 family)